MPASNHSEILYLLDTNILIHGVRGSQVWQKIKMICDPLMVEPRPSICVVSEGELCSFAEQQQWSDIKQSQMEFLLDYFLRASIDSPPVLRAYAKIDSWSRTKGIRMGKNDLWIAATAHVTNAVLVTTDRDFDHLHSIVLHRTLINL